MSKTISIRPHGADLTVITKATLATVGGMWNVSVLQTWTWRNGEAVVVERRHERYGTREISVVVRQGLKAGTPTILCAGSIAAALASLGHTWRNAGPRRQPRQIFAGSREEKRQTIAKAVRRQGKMFRTLWARYERQVAA